MFPSTQVMVGRKITSMEAGGLLPQVIPLIVSFGAAQQSGDVACLVTSKTGWSTIVPSPSGWLIVDMKRYLIMFIMILNPRQVIRIEPAAPNPVIVTDVTEL